MKEIEPLLEGTIFTTKTAFAAEAIKEKIEAVKKEQAEHSLKLLTDEFTDKQVQYRRHGINNIADLARTTIMNTENITELEKKLESYIKVEEEHKEQDKWFVQYKKDNPDIEEKLDSLEKNMEKKARSIFKKEMDWLDKKIKRLKKVEAEILRKRSKK